MHTIVLFLNDVDGYEILVIVFVVLIFFGPKSIPGIAKTLGKALFSIRNASSELQNEIRKSGLDIKKDLNINDILNKEQQEILQPMDQVFTDIENTMDFRGKISPVSTESISSENETLAQTDETANISPVIKKKARSTKVKNKDV